MRDRGQAVATHEHLEKRVDVAAPQSFGSLLNLHPHAHALCSLGVFDSHGVFHEDTDLDFSAAELPFREAIFSILRKRGVIDDARIQMMHEWPTLDSGSITRFIGRRSTARPRSFVGAGCRHVSSPISAANSGAVPTYSSQLKIGRSAFECFTTRMCGIRVKNQYQ